MIHGSLSDVSVLVDLNALPLTKIQGLEDFNSSGTLTMY